MNESMWEKVEAVSGNEPMEVVLLLSDLTPGERSAFWSDPYGPGERSKSTGTASEDRGGGFTKLLGADKKVFNEVKDFLLCAKSRGDSLTISVVPCFPARIIVKGKASEMEEAFDVKLYKWRDRSKPGSELHIAPEREPRLAQMFDHVAAVIGLDCRPAPGLPAPVARAEPALWKAVPTGGSTLEHEVHTAVDLARLYEFPERFDDQDLDGRGEKLGVIVLCSNGGGLPVDFTPHDGAPVDSAVFDAYFKCIGKARPKVALASVHGARNHPSSAGQLRNFVLKHGLGKSDSPLKGREGEAPRWGGPVTGSGAPMEPGGSDTDDLAAMVTLDAAMAVEIFGALAPGAEIEVILCATDVRGIFDAILRAVDDGVTVLALTWGWPENDMPDWVGPINTALAYAVSRGVSVVCSSGDDGSTPSSFSDSPTPIFPASSPLVLAVGGTSLVSWCADAPGREVVWNEELLGQRRASGGGYSREFPRPAWQTGLPDENKPPELRMRGVPDIASNAANDSGAWLWLGNELNARAVGTSAAALQIAALVALLRQGLRISLPDLNRVLYHDDVRPAMQSITEGSNAVRDGVDHYQAGEGWNPCAGLGRPNGIDLLKRLKRYYTEHPDEQVHPIQRPIYTSREQGATPFGDQTLLIATDDGIFRLVKERWCLEEYRLGGAPGEWIQENLVEKGVVLADLPWDARTDPVRPFCTCYLINLPLLKKPSGNP